MNLIKAVVRRKTFKITRVQHAAEGEFDQHIPISESPKLGLSGVATTPQAVEIP